MKTFFSLLIRFFLFALVGYIALLVLWIQLAPEGFRPPFTYRIGAYGHALTRYREVDTVTKAQVVVVGSSHAYRGFDTEFFAQRGISMFNLGSSAQTPLQSDMLLRRYIPRLKPQIVILEVYPPTFAMDGVESAIDLLANDKNDLGSWRMAFEMRHPRVFNTLLYGSVRDLAGLNKHIEEPVHKELDTYVSGGFVRREAKYYKPLEEESMAIKPREEQMEALDRMLAYLRAKGIRPVLVFAPVTHEHYKSFSNVAEFEQLLSSKAEFFNFNGLPGLSDSLHFYDSNHLNQPGVEIFDRALLERIPGIGGQPL